MQEASLRMADMINGVIPGANNLLTTLDEGRSKPSPLIAVPKSEHSPVRLASLLDVIVSLKRVAVGSATRINLDVSQGSSLLVRINPTDFKQALANLLDNAVESTLMREDAFIGITLSEQDGQAVISIQDNGCGMSAEVLDQIGQRGFTHGKKNGNGLGVHHALQVVTGAGGRISFDSGENGGTLVEVFIPVAEILRESKMHGLMFKHRSPPADQAEGWLFLDN